jgi:hypothetical protein
MNENYEHPKVEEIKTYEANFFRVYDSKNWRPVFNTGPFLPITSSGEGNLPYKLDDMRSSTFWDNFLKSRVNLICRST